MKNKRKGPGNRKVPNDENALPCPGEAHTNPYIDHCGLCMGCTWGRVWKTEGNGATNDPGVVTSRK